MINLKNLKILICFIVSVLFIFVTIDFVPVDSEARGRGGGRGGGHKAHRSGGGHHRSANVSRQGPSRSGSLNSNRSRSSSRSRSANRSTNRSGQGNRQANAQNRQGNRQDNAQNRQGNRENNRGDREDNRQDWQDERRDYQEGVRDERRDYAEDVRSERREYAEHAEWNNGIVEWDEGTEWGALVAAGVFVTGTAIAVSSFNNAPCTMTSTVINGQTYYQCDNYWYQEAYQGGEVVYVVVNPPY